MSRPVSGPGVRADVGALRHHRRVTASRTASRAASLAVSLRESFEAYAALAAEHLPADAAARWTALLRPCVRLTKPAADRPAGSGPVAARLGGEPLLPPGTPWPHWPGHGPLSFIASVDCALLPRTAVDPAFPDDGTLLFFFFDGQVDDADAAIGADDPETRPAARVLYVPADAACGPAATPDELEPYPGVDLVATARCSAPDPWHPQSLAALTGDGTPLDPRRRPRHVVTFMNAVFAAEDGIGHRVGGHARPVQGPVEYEVAHAVLGPDGPWTGPEPDAEARRWTLLAQIDTDQDAGMMWGDCGTLYWLIRPEDLAARRFDEARFTWQCC